MLRCKLCEYAGKQLHQHIKAIHNMTAAQYRNKFGESEVMQLGFNPKIQNAKKYNSDYVKSGYRRIEEHLSKIDIYSRLELLDLLIYDETWKKYCGKSKYRTLINDNPKLYKSIMYYTSFMGVVLENRMKYIIEFNYDIDKCKCSCGKKITFGQYCRRCPDPKRTWVGRSHTSETKHKQRESTLAYIEQMCGQVTPRYNVKSISLINEYGTKHGYNFQHAENGGEFRVLGYFVDGYDFEKNVVLEIDEPHHYDSDGKLKKSDITRQEEITEFLGCEFIRIKI